MPPEGRARRPSAPGIPGYSLPGGPLRAPAREVQVCSQSLPPGASLPPPSVEAAPPSARKHWELKGPQGFRLVLPIGMLAALGSVVTFAAREVVQARQEIRDAVATTARFQAQLDELKAAKAAGEKRDASLEKRASEGENWTGAVLSQALGVDVRRKENAPPLPALRITVPLRKPSRIDPRAPIVVVETPQPTGE